MAPWNAESDRRLLLAVITALSPNPPSWAQVAALMGEGYTVESCRQHYAKLKKSAGDELGTTSSKQAAPSTPTAGSKKRKQSTKSANGANQSNDDDDETPSKKPKGFVKAEAEEI